MVRVAIIAGFAGVFILPHNCTNNQAFKKIISENASFFQQIQEKAQKLTVDGYVTFYHGQGVRQRVPIQLDTCLYGLTKKLLPDNFAFMHTKHHPLLPTSCEKDDVLHRKLLDNKSSGNSQSLLFLTDSMLGNQKDLKKNSLYYFFANRNDSGGYYITLETIFANYGLESYAKRFVPKLEKLEQDYITNVSRYGTLYLLAIPKETVHKSVIPVDSDGCLQPLVVNRSKTTDMQKIATALQCPSSRVEPADEREYTLVMTHSHYGGNNPDSGILVFAYIIPYSQKALEDWTREWQATLEELANAIRASKN